MATVLIPFPLRQCTLGRAAVEVDGATVAELLAELVSIYPRLSTPLLDDDGRLHRFVAVFVNDADIRLHAGLATPLKPDDTIDIVPAISGGMAPREPGTFAAAVPQAADLLPPDWRSRLTRTVPLIRIPELQASTAGGEKAPWIIDVRSDDEWAQGHIAGSVHLDRGFLELRIESVVPDRSAMIVCVCETGLRSLLSANTLRGLGYINAASLEGGLHEWKAQGLALTVPRRLSAIEQRRYARHLVIPEIGDAGQLKLLTSRVLLVGAGGLGSPAGLYLAAAGVGTIGIVDADRVEVSNLQRQVLHRDRSIGSLKTDSAQATLQALNPDITVVTHPLRLERDNVLSILRDYDVVVDGSDNFHARYLINDACAVLGIPFVHGSVFRFDGQLSVFWPGNGPCYRCIYPQAPPPALAPSCADAGVLGVLPGTIGVLQATETVKLLLGIGQPLIGSMLRYDALAGCFRVLALAADPHCATCSATARPMALLEGARADTAFCQPG